jgi:hypothetical protein
MGFVICVCCVLRRPRHVRRVDHVFRKVLPGVCVCGRSRNPNNEAA